jgi:hypothetical protein
MKKLIIATLFLLIGCAGPKFSATCIIPETRVNIFSSPYHTGAAARGWIGVSGDKIDGRIYPHKEVLAHEIEHLLDIYCPGVFHDPDKR